MPPDERWAEIIHELDDLPADGPDLRPQTSSTSSRYTFSYWRS